MPSSTPHQKFCFYHLPTQGRASIKLGDAWYVSNVSIIFDCSMLYYLLFWTILGFIFHFYIIFGTNLLTGGPAQNCCFFAYFRVSQKKNIKRSPNGMKPSGTWFSERTWSRGLGPYVKTSTRRARGRGAPSYLVEASAASWLALQVLWTTFVPKILLPKVSFRLDSVWYSFSSKHWNKGKTETGTGLWVNRLVPKIIWNSI